MSLYIEVTVEPGHSIPRILNDLVDAANRLGLAVRADLNGLLTTIRPGDSADLALANWEFNRTQRVTIDCGLSAG